MNFQEMLEHLQTGGKAARPNWISKNAYIFIIKGEDLLPIIKEKYSDKTDKNKIHDAIVMHTNKEHLCLTYTVKQADLFATDWVCL